MIRAYTALVVAFGLSAVMHARPLILVGQDYESDFTDVDPNLDVMRPLARALQEVRAADTVIWSQGDPLISTLIQAGAIKWVEKPKLADLAKAAQELRAQHVLLCKATVSGLTVKAVVTLYDNRGARSLWSDTANTAVVTGDLLDRESTAITIGNTWCQKLMQGPLKADGGAVIRNPDPGDPAITPSVRTPIDKEPLANGLKALEEGRPVEAVALLRDAVDADPTSEEARLALVRALKAAGKPFLAAQEAARAVSLIPNSAGLLLAAADAWMEGGLTDQAFELARQALAQDSKNANALALLGDLYLGRLDITKAIEYYDQALLVREDPEFLYRRSQARAMQENFAGATADMTRAKELGLSTDPVVVLRRYAGTARMMDAVFISLTTGARNLLAEAKTFPDQEGLNRRAVAFVNRCAAFAGYVEMLAPPEKHAASHRQRGLAVNLLLQASVTLQRYCQNRESESPDDANLLQIEASREYAGAQKQFQAELSTK